MPQMAPLWWTTLFLMFLTAFMIMCTINYFIIKYEPSTHQTEKKIKNSINWKW
uniref:ATP synthase complex subunit 8 n=1 Tax=Diplonychus sp. TaxID=2977879 RepID=A0AAU6PCF3_9HEMI